MEITIVVNGAGTHADVLSAAHTSDLPPGERHVIGPGESLFDAPYEVWRRWVGREVDLLSFLPAARHRTSPHDSPSPPASPGSWETAAPSIAITEVLDTAFRLVRAAPVPLLLLAVLLHAPLLLTRMFVLRAPDFGSVVLAGALAAVWFFPTAALVLGLSRVRNGESLTARAVARRMLARAGTVFASVLLGQLIVLLGMLFLVVPGIFAMVRLYLVVPALMVENRGPVEALERSNALARGYGWPIFGTLCVLAVLGALVQGGLAPLATIGGIPGLGARALAVAAELFLLVLGAAVVVAWYFAIRVAREGFDVQQAAEALAPEAREPTLS